MVTQKKLGFGFGAERFAKITFHPNLDPTGLNITRPDACDPCLYHPQDLKVIFEVNRNKKIYKDPWRYKKELEEWAQNLGYRNPKILAQRRWQSSILGPAWTKVPDPAKYEPACRNMGFGRTPRFKPSKNNLPGPGTYYTAVPFKAPHGPHSTRQTMDREEPCRFKPAGTKWSLAPNRYTIIDNENIENKSKRIVSKRGPYDIFTGKRDGSTIKNHFNTTMRVSAKIWPKAALPGSLEKYNKTHYGVMNKTNRDQPYRGRNGVAELNLCIRKPNEPGPASYGLHGLREFKQNKYGFNMSYDRAPGYVRAAVWPATGRYSAKTPSCGVRGHGHRHVFLTKAPRTIGAVLPEMLNTF